MRLFSSSRDLTLSVLSFSRSVAGFSRFSILGGSLVGTIVLGLLTAILMISYLTVSALGLLPSFLRLQFGLKNCYITLKVPDRVKGDLMLNGSLKIKYKPRVGIWAFF